MSKVAIGLIVGWMLSTVALAEENVLGSRSGTSGAISDMGGCASNFSVTGSFLAGKQFKTSVVLPEVGSQVAFRRARAVIAKSDRDWTSEVYRITKSDEKAGVISAVWGGVGNEKTTPLLTLHIESFSGAGAKIDFTFSTAGGTLIDGVGDAFCKITSAVLNSTTPDGASAVEKADSANTQSEVKAFNSEFIKNGMPCVKEICLGDGIDALRKIKWDKADKVSAAVVKKKMADLEKNYRGDLIASAPYLAVDESHLLGAHHFDNQALAKLDEVTAACFGAATLVGKFTTQSGNPTTVKIDLMPTLDNSEQKWTVVSITRSFPSARSEKQLEEIRAQLDDRYGAFSYISQMKGPQKECEFQHFYNGPRDMYGGVTFSLETKSPDVYECSRLHLPTLTERIRLHPACGGTAKVKID